MKVVGILQNLNNFYNFSLAFCSENASITFSKLMFAMILFSMDKIPKRSNFFFQHLKFF